MWAVDPPERSAAPRTRPPLTLPFVLARLRHRWAAVIIVLVLALVAGAFVWSRGYSVELTSAEILVDTPDSQTVDIGSRPTDESGGVPQFDTLAARASLLGNLMSSGRIEAAIAADAGLPADKLDVVAPGASPEAEGVDLPPEPAAASDRDATSLTVATDGVLPIVRVIAQAPDTGTSKTLAEAAVRQLGEYVDDVAAGDDIPDDRRLVVRPVGGPRSVTDARGPGIMLAVVAALAVLGAGAAVLVLLPPLQPARGLPRVVAVHNGYAEAPRGGPTAQRRGATEAIEADGGR